MYLLGLEGYWPFTGDVREVDSSDKVYVEICFATFAVSCIIWIIAHVVGTLAACAGLYHVFFEE